MTPRLMLKGEGAWPLTMMFLAGVGVYDGEDPDLSVFRPDAVCWKA